MTALAPTVARRWTYPTRRPPLPDEVAALIERMARDSASSGSPARHDGKPSDAFFDLSQRCLRYSQVTWMPLVGSCGLHDRVGPGALEIGYWLHSDYRGCGYATMATKALTNAALAQPRIERLVIKHDAANAARSARPRGIRRVRPRRPEVTPDRSKSA